MAPAISQGEIRIAAATPCHASTEPAANATRPNAVSSPRFGSGRRRIISPTPPTSSNHPRPERRHDPDPVRGERDHPDPGESREPEPGLRHLEGQAGEPDHEQEVDHRGRRHPVRDPHHRAHVVEADLHGALVGLLLVGRDARPQLDRTGGRLDGRAVHGVQELGDGGRRDARDAASRSPPGRDRVLVAVGVGLSLACSHPAIVSSRPGDLIAGARGRSASAGRSASRARPPPQMRVHQQEPGAGGLRRSGPDPRDRGTSRSATIAARARRRPRRSCPRCRSGARRRRHRHRPRRAGRAGRRGAAGRSHPPRGARRPGCSAPGRRPSPARARAARGRTGTGPGVASAHRTRRRRGILGTPWPEPPTPGRHRPTDPVQTVRGLLLRAHRASRRD